MVSCSVSAPLVGGLICNAQKNAYIAANSEIYDYMLHTDSGMMLTFPVDEAPIGVLIKDMPEDDKQDIIDAVNGLDNISTNINYKILDSDSCKIDAKIVIEDRPRTASELGLTNLQFNEKTGVINQPVYIKIDLDACHNIYNSKGENAVTAVTKHELAHALGFSDLYDKKYIDESIMYYQLAVVEDFTDSDKYRIRKVYGGTAENVSYDTNLSQDNLNQKDNISTKNQIAEVLEPKYMTVQKQKKIAIFKKEQLEQERGM